MRAVGETGLDYYRTKDEVGIARQQLMFRRHIATAKRHDRTLVIHDRDAHDDIVRVLDEEGWPERVVFHCFSGDAEFARRCLQHNSWISFAGNVSYKANQDLRDALAVVPVDRILVETDAPYLTPMPHRGRANAPYLLPHIVAFIAEQRDLDLAQACVQFADNAVEAFGGRLGHFASGRRTAGWRPARPDQVRKLAKQTGLRASTKQRGQNFVVDANTVRRIVADRASAQRRRGARGSADLGSLTLGLLETGARVTPSRSRTCWPTNCACHRRPATGRSRAAPWWPADALEVTELPGPAPATGDRQPALQRVGTGAAAPAWPPSTAGPTGW